MQKSASTNPEHDTHVVLTVKRKERSKTEARTQTEHGRSSFYCTCVSFSNYCTSPLYLRMRIIQQMLLVDL